VGDTAGDRVNVDVGVLVEVSVAVGVKVFVGVADGIAVKVGSDVAVPVIVGVKVGTEATIEPPDTAHSPRNSAAPSAKKPGRMIFPRFF